MRERRRRSRSKDNWWREGSRQVCVGGGDTKHGLAVHLEKRREPQSSEKMGICAGVHKREGAVRPSVKKKARSRDHHT